MRGGRLSEASIDRVLALFLQTSHPYTVATSMASAARTWRSRGKARSRARRLLPPPPLGLGERGAGEVKVAGGASSSSPDAQELSELQPAADFTQERLARPERFAGFADPSLPGRGGPPGCRGRRPRSGGYPPRGAMARAGS